MLYKEHYYTRSFFRTQNIYLNLSPKWCSIVNKIWITLITSSFFSARNITDQQNRDFPLITLYLCETKSVVTVDVVDITFLPATSRASQTLSAYNNQKRIKKKQARKFNQLSTFAPRDFNIEFKSNMSGARFFLVKQD